MQDEESLEVLMLAYANKVAVEQTIKTGQAHYFSTSRQKLWLKGESSGNTQAVSEVLLDCDGDAFIYKVSQKTGACHKGYRSCFFRKVEGDDAKIFCEKVFDPDNVYGKK